MDDIKSKLLSLTDQELRNYLEASEGYDGTPVTPSTRMLLVRKLTRNLLKNSSTDDTVECATLSKNSSTKTIQDDSSTNELDLKQSSDCLNESQKNTKQIFYGVYLPCKIDIKLKPDAEKSHNVFFDKKEVIKFMKEFPEARFKVFQTRREAEEFTRLGAESSVDFQEISATAKNNTEPSVISGEKTSSFKAPKPQELVQLRKAIEKGDIAKFYETVWKNPRYLVGSGDTPTILQEGSRYNALHVASKAGNAGMCEAILETVSNPSFIRLLYNSTDEPPSSEHEDGLLALSPTSVPKQEDQAVLDCIAYLLDLYLNTPEKGRNDTPLHFASKFGKVDAVKALVSYPMCDRTRPNKFGETPEDLICSRADHASEDDKRKIRQLIKDRFYVPVMRPGDLSQQASIGEPFSPEKAPISSPETRRDPKSPMKEINAYAGPMSLEEAWDFCRKWKSPLKAVNGKCSLSALSPSHRGLSSPSSCSSSPLRLCDPDRGLEREGRVLANELQVGWMEYWPFLGEFANFSSKAGMKILENYLCQRLHDSYKLKRQSKETTDNGKLPDVGGKLVDVEKSPDGINTVPQEITPITELCQALEYCTLSSGKKDDEYQKKPSHNHGCTNLVEPLQGASPSPLHYVEKSCRIFARRISDSLIREIFKNSKRIASNSVGPEVHHLRRLVSSFKEDSRFLSVDFSCMHSRISAIAADGIIESVSSSDATKVMDALVYLPTTSTHMCSSSDEEDDKCLEKDRDSQAAGREWRISMRHSLHKSEGFGFEEEVDHVRCLMTLIKKSLEKRLFSLTSPCGNQEEGDRIETAWAKTEPCSCIWSCPNSSHHHTKISSRASLAAVSRRLSFEYAPASENLAEKNSSDISGCWRSQNSSAIGIQSDGNEKSSEGGSGVDNNDGETESDDVFYTPPSSPAANNSHISSSEDEDEFMEDTEEIVKVFIKGDLPTKLDLDVLYALEGAENINPLEFPYIYQWKNLVLMHSVEERASWLSPYAPKWRRQPGLSGSLMGKSSSRHAAPSPSLLFSNRHHQPSCSPLALR